MTRPVVFLCIALLPLGACSRGAPQKSAEAAAAPAPEARQPLEDAAAGEKEAPASAMPPPPEADHDAARKKKADGNPLLSQPPAEEALGPKPFEPSEQDDVERLDREERQFQQAIDPEALSCAGALPRRDAICSLAKKICELTPPTDSLSAQKDCEKAQSACTNAKASYKGRCGG
jgi:hypothetical protein